MVAIFGIEITGAILAGIGAVLAGIGSFLSGYMAWRLGRQKEREQKREDGGVDRHGVDPGGG